MPSVRGRKAVAFGCALVFGMHLAFACNVPVFRYALERWPAGIAELVVFHRGALPAADQQRLENLQRMAERTAVNVRLEAIDLQGELTNERKKLWSTQSNAPLPRAILRLPDASETEAPIWAGAWANVDEHALISSPARAELGRRLLQGDSTVWVMIESSNAAENERVATLLTNELSKLEGSLKLPPSAPDDPAPLSALPVRVAFSIQRVARIAAEDLFVRMLLHGEAVKPDSTVVVPVFGRGRALTALSGSEINASVLRQAATFLCGACSCEVKEMNPGKDLVMAVRWDSIFTDTDRSASVAAVPKAGELVAIAPGLPESAPAAPAPRPKATNARRGLKLLASTGLAFAAITVLLVGIVLLRSLRQR